MPGKAAAKPKATPKGGAKPKKGLAPKLFKGLDKKRMQKGGGIRLAIQQDETVPVQFLTDPSEFVEYYVHNFQEDGRWEYVPCAGEDACPLCEDERDVKRKTGYRFACNVVDLRDRKVKILEGPKDLANRIQYRYERNPKKFTARTFEVRKISGNVVSYEVSPGEDVPLGKDTVGKLKEHDLEKYVLDGMTRYYGEDFDAAAASALDEEPEEEEEDEELEDEDEDLEEAEEEEDEDEEEEDEEEEVEEEEEEDEEEEDEDEEDEEEEDDKPAPKANRRVAKTKPAAKTTPKRGGRK